MRKSIFIEGSTVGIFGFGETGQSIVEFLMAKNFKLIIFDDNPSNSAQKYAKSLGLKIHQATDDIKLAQLIEEIDIFMPTPGLPESHPVFAHVYKMGHQIASEFDLAAQYDDRPVIAITGTNGKTTVTMMVKEMLLASGIKVEAVGNTEIPLVKAISDLSIEKFIVEASSFRLGWSSIFSPEVSVWLNFSPDHLDVHDSLTSYEIAKASMWSNHESHQVAIGNAEDEVVMKHLPERGVIKTFGWQSGTSQVIGDSLVIDGQELLEISELKRSSPHDVLNALAAATLSIHSGATIDAIRNVLKEFKGLPHRISFVGRKDEVEWYNDSKSTTPHSVIAAVNGFENVILIVGGRNKGLNLGILTCVESKIKRLIAIGEAADEITGVLGTSMPVSKAESMKDAVIMSSEFSERGDVILLSPGCASFDWYQNYVERGEDFEKIVQTLIGGQIGNN